MTNAEPWFNIALRPRKPEGSLGRTAQDGHLDAHTAPELCTSTYLTSGISTRYYCSVWPHYVALGQCETEARPQVLMVSSALLYVHRDRADY